MSAAMPKANESELDKAIGDALQSDTNNFIGTLLIDRGKTHGRFHDHARVTQSLKMVLRKEIALRNERKQIKITPEQQEALEMILHKIGRIIAGDADFEDHWEDIAGYATLCTTKGGSK